MAKRHTVGKRVIDVLAAVVLLGLGALAVFLIEQNKVSQVEVARQQRLAALVAKLPAPAGCVDVQQTYKAADGGTVPGWTVYYMCKTTGGAAYDVIVQAVQSLKLRAETNDAIPEQSLAGQLHYDFSYLAADARVRYEFLPAHRYETVDDLRASPLTSIRLTVSDLT